MLYSQIRALAKEIAKGTLIEYTKKELLSPEAADLLKSVIIENAEICLSGLVIENDLIP
jgi:hypothetical protein